MRTKAELEENLHMIQKAKKDARGLKEEGMVNYFEGAEKTIDWILDKQEINFIDYTVCKDKKTLDIINNMIPKDKE